jgi:predicted peptidase
MIRTEFREEKWIFPFVEYTPIKDKKLPLIIQLHGAGERGDGKEDLIKVDKLGFSNLIKNTDAECRFIMPQCQNGTFWAAKVESIIKFIEQIKAEFPTDETRIYLTGPSMGGFGTWYTAMAVPDMFAAIAPVCGGGMDWNARVLKMPIWTFHGNSDNVVNPAYTEMMVASLKKAGADVTYTKLENIGHNAWDYAYTKELLDWLLSKHK